MVCLGFRQVDDRHHASRCTAETDPHVQHSGSNFFVLKKNHNIFSSPAFFVCFFNFASVFVVVVGGGGGWPPPPFFFFFFFVGG